MVAAVTSNFTMGATFDLSATDRLQPDSHIDGFTDTGLIKVNTDISPVIGPLRCLN